MRIATVSTGLERLPEQPGRLVLVLGSRPGEVFEPAPYQRVRPEAGLVTRLSRRTAMKRDKTRAEQEARQDPGRCQPGRPMLRGGRTDQVCWAAVPSNR